ncbi:MAG: hypothetical protein U0U69_04825 [Acidimicrobiia bacterium]
MQPSPGLVLAQWGAGMIAIVFVVNRWKVTSPGYAWLVDACAAALALFAWAAGGRSEPALVLTAGAAALAIVFSAVKLRGAPQAVAEAVGAAAGMWVCARLAYTGADPGWIAAVRALAGAAFLGAVTDAMILGHWYLIDPKLPKVAIRRLNVVAAGTLVAFGLTLVVPPDSVLTAFGSATLMALGWVATSLFCGILVFLVGRALREDGYAAVMSATGLLYVATMVAVGVVVTGALAAR